MPSGLVDRNYSFEKVIVMVISSVSAGLVQEARRFSTENQSRLERTTESRLRTERRDFVTETSQTDSVSEPDRIVSIAEYLAPDSPEVQEQLSSLAPALNAPINEQLRDALNLSDQSDKGQDNYSSVQPSISAYSTTLNGNNRMNRAHSANLSSRSINNLFEVANLISRQESLYNAVIPPLISITTGISANGTTVNRRL